MSGDCISVTGLRATGYHGVFDHERRDGQQFVVDLTLWLHVDTGSDDLADTVDYSQLSAGVVDIVTGPPLNLIETLAGRIADYALSFERVYAVDVTVHKPDAPMGVDFGDVAVTITRRKP